MKRKMKTLITAFAVCAISAFAVMASGCMGVPEWLEQARCTHKWNDGEVTKEATCEGVGEKTVTCTLCGYEDIEYIPATGHAWINTDAVEPTCTQVGQMAGIRCATCAEWFIQPTEIPATGHIDVTDTGHAPTCTETGLTDGSHCGVCNEILTAQEGIPANGHNVVTVAGKAPTCTETGLTDEEVCTTCGVMLSAQEEIPMIACADEDGDGYCDMCNIIMPLAEGTYTEVAATVGETVAGNWYRVYFKEYNGNYYPGALFNFEGLSFGFRMATMVEPAGVFLYSSTIVKIPNTLVIIQEGENDKGIYADFYFNIGSCTYPMPTGEKTLNITEETTITSITGEVYRLQVNEGGEVAQPDDVEHPAEGTYTEVAATVGETVAGNWYRFYYDENARLDLRFVNGFEQPDISLNVGFMLYVDNSQLNFMALDGSVTVPSDSSLEFVLNEDGQYVDFFIPQGFILNAYNTIGTEEVYSVQFTDEILLSSVSQLDKLFVLEVK